MYWTTATLTSMLHCHKHRVAVEQDAYSMNSVGLWRYYRYYHFRTRLLDRIDDARRFILLALDGIFIIAYKKLGQRGRREAPEAHPAGCMYTKVAIVRGTSSRDLQLLSESMERHPDLISGCSSKATSEQTQEARLR